MSDGLENENGAAPQRGRRGSLLPVRATETAPADAARADRGGDQSFGATESTDSDAYRRSVGGGDRFGGGSGGPGGSGGGGEPPEDPPYDDDVPERQAPVRATRSQRAVRWFKSPSFPMLIFLGLSWTSTTLGLLGLISADRGAPTQTEFIVVGVLVFAATLTMKLLLDLLLQSRTIMKGVLSLSGYAVLMALSVGFGFAFYWELLEARRQSFDGARGAISDTSRKLENGRATLQQISVGLASLASDSADKARREERVGFTCQANIGPGPGPRREFRRSEAARFSAAAAGVSERIADEEAKIVALSERLQALEAAAAKGVSADAERDAEFARINADFARFEAEFNAFLTAGPLAGLADQFSSDAVGYRDPNFVRTGPGSNGQVSSFICTDIAFAARLDQMAATIRGIDPVSFGSVRVIEGAGATTEAFDRLTTSAGDVLFFWRGGNGGEEAEIITRFKLEEARKAAERGDQEAAALVAASLVPTSAVRQGLISRDLVPLFTALIVDLMILVLTLLEGRSSFMTVINDGMQRAAGAPMRLREFMKLSREIAGDKTFQLFAAYRVTYARGFYIAAPTSVASDPELAADDRAMYNLLWALKSKRLAKRFYAIGLSNDAISEQLKNQGSRAAGRKGYELWKLDDAFWDEAIDGLYSDAREHRAGSRQQRARRKTSA